MIILPMHITRMSSKKSWVQMEFSAERYLFVFETLYSFRIEQVLRIVIAAVDTPRRKTRGVSQGGEDRQSKAIPSKEREGQRSTHNFKRRRFRFPDRRGGGGR